MDRRQSGVSLRRHLPGGADQGQRLRRPLAAPARAAGLCAGARVDQRVALPQTTDVADEGRIGDETTLDLRRVLDLCSEPGAELERAGERTVARPPDSESGPPQLPAAWRRWPAGHRYVDARGGDPARSRIQP